MSHAAYVYSGYALTAAVLAAYSWWIISKARKLKRQEAPPRS